MPYRQGGHVENLYPFEACWPARYLMRTPHCIPMRDAMRELASIFASSGYLAGIPRTIFDQQKKNHSLQRTSAEQLIRHNIKYLL